MIVGLLLALQVTVSSPPASGPATPDPARSGDAVPRVTLAQAITRATRLDPNYVQAMGQVDNAEWGRRAALLTLVLPSLSASLDATKYSTEFFNVGTGRNQAEAVNASLVAQYDLFNARKFTDLGRTRAELEGAEATELEQRFRTALQVESDYYAVLQNQELSRVAADRARRAEAGLAVARARVVSGAAVQSDSLQLVLELTQARTDQLRRDAALRVSRLQLGRRIGEPGPVDAEPVDTAAAPELPLSADQAVQVALGQGPQYRAARASERAASAFLRGIRGQYLPQVTLTGTHLRFDDSFFPSARTVNSLALTVSLPIWNDGRREIAVSQARVNRDVARAIRSDLERAARPDVTAAVEAYATARATTALSQTGVVVARENYRVQDSRYRAGSTTILDVLDAQLRLTQSEADLVQSRYAARLALAGLEAILGRRLFTNGDQS
ncbi:MAG TPA: TolC family protein [Gemmatimonadales bacterium]|nr:TolC family protein [Gemmatimonadales bacterium]